MFIALYLLCFAAIGSEHQVILHAVDTNGFAGLSDLVYDKSSPDAASFWSIPDKSPQLLELDLLTQQPKLRRPPIKISGLPKNTDTEALAIVSVGSDGSQLFAIGTETLVQGRQQDSIYFVTLARGQAQVTDELIVPYALWGLKANRNEGIEGLCAVDGFLIAGMEFTGHTKANQRYAPIGLYNTSSKAWTPFKLLLTSTTGRISALACRLHHDHTHIEVLAIERHFGVGRILRVDIPLDNTTRTLTPKLWLDMSRMAVFKNNRLLPNFEGIAWGPNNSVYLLSDNDYGVVTGPTQLLIIPADYPSNL